jgi:gamma-glutamylcysteine synthetase
MALLISNNSSRHSEFRQQWLASFKDPLSEALYDDTLPGFDVSDITSVRRDFSSAMLQKTLSPVSLPRTSALDVVAVKSIKLEHRSQLSTV